MKNRWKYIVIAMLSLVVIFHIGVVIYIADEDFELTSKDYYDRTLTYQETIEAARLAKSLKWEYRISESGRTLLLAVRTPDAEPARLEAATLTLYRPDNSDLDHHSNLEVDGEGFRATIPQLAKGRWRLTVNGQWQGKPVHYETDFSM